MICIICSTFTFNSQRREGHWIKFNEWSLTLELYLWAKFIFTIVLFPPYALSSGVTCSAFVFVAERQQVCVWVHRYGLVCRTPVSPCIKRGRVSNCDCGLTHSCTAGHAFYAGSCCTVSRWRSWRKNLTPDHACCCRPSFLWAPSPSLSLGSYPAEEQDKQKQRGKFVNENWGSVLLCRLQCGWVWHHGTVSLTGCAREDEEAACTAGKRWSVTLPYLYWRSPSSCSSESWESSSPWCPSPPSLHDPPRPHSWRGTGSVANDNRIRLFFGCLAIIWLIIRKFVIIRTR